MKQMQRGAAGNSTPKRLDDELSGHLLPRPGAPSQTFHVEHVVTDLGPDGQPWPPTILMNGWVLVRDLPKQQVLWRRITLRAAAPALTGWPAELVAEVAAAPDRRVAALLILASGDAIAALPDDTRELLGTRLQDTLAELPER
jgi:hypothetical protein